MLRGSPDSKSITEAEAAVKHWEMQKVHAAFQKKLQKHLGNSGETWTPFSQIIMEMFPNSLKRGSQQKSWIKAQSVVAVAVIVHIPLVLCFFSCLSYCKGRTCSVPPC